MSGVVLITGASSGIGLETCVYLAGKGLRVVGTMRNPAKSGELQAAASKAGVQVDVAQLDVTSTESIESAVKTIAERYGKIDGLVNNAGISIRGFFEDLSQEEIKKVFETNVFGTMAVTRAVLPHMRAARQGRIVLMTSVAGLIGAPAMGAYCSSKFALEGFGETLALEAGLFGIHVSLIEPGNINTQIWQSNSVVAGRANDPRSPYKAYFAESEKMAEWAVRTTPIKASHVAKAIYDALTSKSPKLRYLIGYRPGVVLALRRIIPSGIFDRLYTNSVVGKISRAGS